MCTCWGLWASQPLSGLDNGLQLAMASTGDMASDLEFPCTVLVGWDHAHSVLWCVSSMWVWTFFGYRKQRKESEFKKTMAIFQNGSYFKQKYANVFHISTYLERVLLSHFDWLLRWRRGPLCAFDAELCGQVWWKEPLGVHRLTHPREARENALLLKGSCDYVSPAQIISLILWTILFKPHWRVLFHMWGNKLRKLFFA